MIDIFKVWSVFTDDLQIRLIVARSRRFHLFHTFYTSHFKVFLAFRSSRCECECVCVCALQFSHYAELIVFILLHLFALLVVFCMLQCSNISICCWQVFSCFNYVVLSWFQFFFMRLCYFYLFVFSHISYCPISVRSIQVCSRCDSDA